MYRINFRKSEGRFTVRILPKLNSLTQTDLKYKTAALGEQRRGLAMRKELWGYRIHGVRAAACNVQSKGLAETYRLNICKAQVL
jgi:hypothetical protein